MNPDLDLVEDGYTEEDSDGKGPVQPVVFKVELVGELHQLGAGGVGVWKWSAGHFEMGFECLKIIHKNLFEN